MAQHLEAFDAKTIASEASKHNKPPFKLKPQ